MFCHHVCLVFTSSIFGVLSERLALTLAVPTWSVPQGVSVVFQVPTPGWVSHLCGLKQLVGVDAFHARLGDIVACVTIQRLNGYCSLPPGVGHLVFGHPARSLSTPTFNVFSLCVDQRKLSTLLGLPLKYRAILLSLGRLPTVLGSRRVTSLLSLRKVSVSHLAQILVQSSQRSTISMAVRAQMMFSRCCCCSRCLLAAWCHH